MFFNINIIASLTQHYFRGGPIFIIPGAPETGLAGNLKEVFLHQIILKVEFSKIKVLLIINILLV